MVLGAFLVLFGSLSLFESIGLISSDTRWGIPVAIICFGVHLISSELKVRNIKKNKIN